MLGHLPKKREIVSYAITDNMLIELFQRFAVNSAKVSFYFSDAFPVYSRICYDSAHKSLKNKS